MFGPSYQAGCPVNSSMADTINGVLPPCALVTCRSSSSPKPAGEREGGMTNADRAVLVTGANRGIGQALVEEAFS
jgi:hypothetical protein